MSRYLTGALALARTNGALQPYSEPTPLPAPDLTARVRQAPMGRTLKSELPGISDVAWTAFAQAMKTSEPGTVSVKNTYGMFEMRPRRLVDVGVMENLRRTKAANGKTVWTGDWRGRITEKEFLSSTRVQYIVFSTSMRLYASDIDNGALDVSGAEDLTLSGALAVLHRCGPSGLRSWAEGKRFSDTIDLVQRTNGIF